MKDIVTNAAKFFWNGFKYASGFLLILFFGVLGAFLYALPWLLRAASVLTWFAAGYLAITGIDETVSSLCPLSHSSFCASVCRHRSDGWVGNYGIFAKKRQKHGLGHVCNRRHPDRGLLLEICPLAVQPLASGRKSDISDIAIRNVHGSADRYDTALEMAALERHSRYDDPGFCVAKETRSHCQE